MISTNPYDSSAADFDEEELVIEGNDDDTAPVGVKKAPIVKKRSHIQFPNFISSIGSKAHTTTASATKKDKDVNAQHEEDTTNKAKHSLRASHFTGPDWRTKQNKKVVGLKDTALGRSVYLERSKLQRSAHSRGSIKSIIGRERKNEPRVSVEEKEAEARKKAETNPVRLLYLGNLAAFLVMLYYMITLETIISSAFTAGLTVYWYFAYEGSSDWSGGGLDFVLLAFTLTAPMSAALGMAFTRRERALMYIADFRSWSYHLYLAHSLWDWPDKDGRNGAVNVDWVEHCDAVMAQLIGIGDELSRFLSLPTTSRSRHRMTRQGRKEAAQTVEVAYYLLDSMATQRLTRLVLYSERLKKIGLPSGEISRMRQYERFLSNTIEQLRMVKMYRTPQAFRSFARIFTLILPPFYAPTYAQVARDLKSLGMGITFGVITCIALTALFESLQILEDPFTAFLALDGIDVREEFEVLHYAQLVNTRKLVFPDAAPYPARRRAALTSATARPSTGHSQHAVGLPPTQDHHQQHMRTTSTVPSVVGITDDMEVQPDDVADELTFTEEQVADVELGIPMDEEDDATIRETAFVDDAEELDLPQRAMLNRITSQGTVRSRRHHRRNPTS